MWGCCGRCIVCVGYLYTHGYMCIYIYICIHIRNICTHMCIYILICMCIKAHAYMCVYIYIYLEFLCVFAYRMLGRFAAPCSFLPQHACHTQPKRLWTSELRPRPPELRLGRPCEPQELQEPPHRHGREAGPPPAPPSTLN